MCLALILLEAFFYTNCLLGGNLNLKFIYIKGPNENPSWISVPLAETIHRQFKVIHTTWRSWFNLNINRNPWGPQFATQWSEHRSYLNRSNNSDLGSLNRDRSVNSDYGSARNIE